MRVTEAERPERLAAIVDDMKYIGGGSVRGRTGGAI